MKVIAINSSLAMDECVAALNRGEMIIFPTETCYGLGVDAANPKAVDLLFDYKGGRGRKPVSVAVANKLMADKYVEINEIAENVYGTLLPGPVTVISKYRQGLAPRIISERNSVGIRIPNYNFVLQLIAKLGRPITATSANTSGMKPPYSFWEWQKYTSINRQAMVSVFVDGGRLPTNPPSTILDTTLSTPTILREGSVFVEMANNAAVFTSDSAEETTQIAAGILRNLKKNHANKPIILALQGELGAGKTHFMKGVAQALSIQEVINSPTYVIAKEYAIPDGGILHHIDTWRFEENDSLVNLDFESMLKANNVIGIEWMQRIANELANYANRALVVHIKIEGDGNEERLIKMVII